jgi:hypothetical protein
MSEDSFICVLVCRTDLDGIFLLYSQMSSRCVVLELDRFSGQVLMVGEFENESHALASLSEHIFVERRRVYAILGVLLGYQSLVLFVATKLRVATLPGGVKVSIVVQADAMTVPLMLNNDNLFSREQLYDMSATTKKYPLDELHYFSTSQDLTIPFGWSRGDAVSSSPAGPNFVWNDFLREGFVQESLERFW